MQRDDPSPLAKDRSAISELRTTPIREHCPLRRYRATAFHSPSGAFPADAGGDHPDRRLDDGRHRAVARRLHGSVGKWHRGRSGNGDDFLRRSHAFQARSCSDGLFWLLIIRFLARSERDGSRSRDHPDRPWHSLGAKPRGPADRILYRLCSGHRHPVICPCLRHAVQSRAHRPVDPGGSGPL